MREDGAETALHVIERTSRSTHQLSKRYRAAPSERGMAITAAQQWVLANRPDARPRYDEEIHRARRERFEAVGRDPLVYILASWLELSPTEIGTILQLGSGRKSTSYCSRGAFSAKATTATMSR